MGFDFTTSAIEALAERFKPFFIADMAPDDPLLDLEVLAGPLQDDPTRRAPYLTIAPDPTLSDLNTHWRVPVTAIKRGMLSVNQDFPQYEVGGQLLYVNFFIMQGWMPKQRTKTDAYQMAGRALRHCEIAHSRMMYDMQHSHPILTDDGMETSSVAYPQMLTSDGMHYEIGGGDKTWLPKLFLRFHIFSGVNRHFMTIGT